MDKKEGHKILNVKLAADAWELLEEYRYRERLPTRTAAVEQLLRQYVKPERKKR